MTNDWSFKRDQHLRRHGIELVGHGVDDHPRPDGADLDRDHGRAGDTRGDRGDRRTLEQVGHEPGEEYGEGSEADQLEWERDVGDRGKPIPGLGEDLLAVAARDGVQPVAHEGAEAGEERGDDESAVSFHVFDSRGRPRPGAWARGPVLPGPRARGRDWVTSSGAYRFPDRGGVNVGSVTGAKRPPRDHAADPHHSKGFTGEGAS